jgi:glycosyltransferase involved in cell wall biosynthesis
MVEKRDERIRIMGIIARMNVGGPAVLVSGLMRGLDSEKFEHLLVTGFCNPDEADYLDTVATDLTATKIPGFGRSISPKADLLAFIAIVKEIRTFRPQIIHTHTAKAGVIGRLASLVSGRKSIRVHTYHGHLLHGYFSPLKTKIVILIEKFLALFTHHLLAVGTSVMDDLLAVGIGNKSKFSVLSPGLELGEISTRDTAAHELDIDASLTYCSFIGRITKIKRPDRFLDVVAEIKKRNVPVHFLVAGAGDLYDDCVAQAKEKDLPVTFLGWRSDIETVLAVSDIVALTSDNEGTPLSLIQAGMAHVPVVTTNVGSVSEIIVNGQGGFIVDTSVTQLADAVEKLVKDPSLRSKMGDFASEYTLKRYGVARLVKDHEDLYLSLYSESID